MATATVVRPPLARLVAASVLPGIALAPILTAPIPSGTIIHSEAAYPGRGYVAPVAGAVARHFDPPAQRWEAGHRGVDFWSAPGEEINSPGAGVVTFAGSVAGKPVVVVTHPDGLRTSLEPVVADVSVGTIVGAGEPVGTLVSWEGNRQNPDHCAALRLPGDDEAACLHWGVRRGEAYIDPLALLGLGAIVLLP